MSGTKRYRVEVNGYQTVLNLSDADAKARGLLAEKPAATKQRRPANKAVTPANK